MRLLNVFIVFIIFPLMNSSVDAYEDQVYPVSYEKSSFDNEPTLFHKANYIVEPYLLGEYIDWSTAVPGKESDVWMVRTSTDPHQVRQSLWKSRDGGRSWNKIRDMDIPFQRDEGVSLNDVLVLPDGSWLLSGHRSAPGLHNGGLPVITFSNDQGKNWTSLRLIGERADDEVYYKMNDRVIRLGNGRLVIPVAHALDRKAVEGAANEAVLFFSDDNGKTWQKSSPTAVPDHCRGMQEPCAVELSDGRLMILARTGSGSHHRCYSSDGGLTWTTPEPTELVAACSPLTLKKMPDGRLMVLYNHGRPETPGDMFPRFPLVYAVSSDDGGHWGRPVIIDDDVENAVNSIQKSEYGYPSICFLKKGILITYGNELKRKCCVIAYP